MNLIKLYDDSNLYSVNEFIKLEFAVKTCLFNEDLVNAGVITQDDIFNLKDADEHNCLFHNNKPICYLQKSLKNINSVMLEKNIAHAIRLAYVEEML